MEAERRDEGENATLMQAGRLKDVGEARLVSGSMLRSLVLQGKEKSAVK